MYAKSRSQIGLGTLERCARKMNPKILVCCLIFGCACASGEDEFDLRLAPLTEADIKAMKAKLSSIEFPIAAGDLLGKINLDSNYLAGRHYKHEKDGVQWIASGPIHENWTVRYRIDQESFEYLDFQILDFHARSEEISKRAYDIGVRIRRLASKAKIKKFVMSREFEDVVIMPKLLAERLSVYGADLLGGDITVRENEIKNEGPSHTLVIVGSKYGISIPLRFDPAFDRFHIVPGFQRVSPIEAQQADDAN